MMIREIKAALAKVARSGLDKLQAGARSTQGNSLNYTSVNTLDPSRLAAAFAYIDDLCIGAGVFLQDGFAHQIIHQ